MNLRALRPFAARNGGARSDRCELCAHPLPEGHRHVVDLRRRTLCCACLPCSILFLQPGAGSYRTVPDRVLRDPGARIAAGDLVAAGIPVRLAFAFFRSDRSAWVCTYPSPAGATEAEVDPAGWGALRTRSGLFAAVQPDVEALLFRGGRGDASIELLLVPIDRCYELAGLLRRHWKGFDGGDEVRTAIDQHWAELCRRSHPLDATGEPR